MTEDFQHSTWRKISIVFREEELEKYKNTHETNPILQKNKESMNSDEGMQELPDNIENAFSDTLQSQAVQPLKKLEYQLSVDNILIILDG